jgi:hypothetical protein
MLPAILPAKKGGEASLRMPDYAGFHWLPLLAGAWTREAGRVIFWP